MTSNRRQVLRLILACGLLSRSPLRLGSLAELTARGACRDDSLSLLHSVNHRESVERVGAEYLRAHPEMATSTALTRAIEVKLDRRGWSKAAGLDESGTARRLQEAIREDFSKGRTISIGGWLLSETEVQLCGLYTVSAKAGVL